MRKFLFSSGVCACLITAIISVWIVANPPLKVAAASATVDCTDGTTRTCEAAGASCYSHDPDGDQHGYCECSRNGTALFTKTCDNDPPDDDPPLLD